MRHPPLAGMEPGPPDGVSSSISTKGGLGQPRWPGWNPALQMECRVPPRQKGGRGQPRWPGWNPALQTEYRAPPRQKGAVVLHLRVEAFHSGRAVLFGLASLALDDHVQRGPLRFDAPGVAGVAEKAGVEVVECFFQCEVVVTQPYRNFAVLLSGPGFESRARFGRAVGAAGGLQVGLGVVLV